MKYNTTLLLLVLCLLASFGFAKKKAGPRGGMGGGMGGSGRNTFLYNRL